MVKRRFRDKRMALQRLVNPKEPALESLGRMLTVIVAEEVPFQLDRLL